MARALERHEKAEARVIPVILRPCDMDGAPFYKLQGLPKDMKPVTRWINQDEAFTDVAIGIRKVAEELRGTLPKFSVENNVVSPSAKQPFVVHRHRSPRKDPYGLPLWGARLEIEVGSPIIAAAHEPQLGTPAPSTPKFWKMPALIDIGASRTLLTPDAVSRAGLTRVDVTRIVRPGGTEDVGVYAASIRFPRNRLATIDVIQVLCCDLPAQPIQCLLGRDILSRWRFTYHGQKGSGQSKRKGLLQALTGEKLRMRPLRSAWASQYTDTYNLRPRQAATGQPIADPSIPAVHHRIPQP